MCGLLHHRFGWSVQRPKRRACAPHLGAPRPATGADLRRFLGGEKATLLWDGLPAHRSNMMRAWLATTGLA
jgi:hypothetical protein